MNKLYNLTFLFLGIFLFATTSVSGQNLLVNGDFETGQAAPWVNGSAVEIDSVTVHAGNYAAQGNIEQYIDLVAGTNYTLTCWAYNVDASINTWVGIRDVTPGGVLVQNFALDSAGYQYVSITFSAPSTGSHRFWCWGANNNPEYYSDSWVLLKEGTTTNTASVKKNDNIEILNQSNQVTVNIEDLNDNATINVFNMTGQLMHTSTTTENKTIIDNSVFETAGSYFIQVKTKGYLVAKQVVIMK